VQIGKLTLQFDQRMIVAGDIAGAAGAGAHPGRGLHHGADHLGMLAHAQIIVRAPDRDRLRPLRRMPHRMRKPPGNALEIGKHPIAPLVMQPRQRAGEIAVVIEVGSVLGISHRTIPDWRVAAPRSKVHYLF
jgi:hypothetical protein